MVCRRSSASPDAVEDEKELDEDAAKGQNAAHDHRRDGARVDALAGNLARDLVGPHGLRVWWWGGRMSGATRGGTEKGCSSWRRPRQRRCQRRSHLLHRRLFKARVGANKRLQYKRNMRAGGRARSALMHPVRPLSAYQRHGNEEPQHHQRHKRAKGHSRRRALAPEQLRVGLRGGRE